jgi:hypothetical protein
MAAALHWAIKDGLGQLGGVMYAGMIGDRFDAEPKRYRMQAAFLLQLAGAMEVACVLCPSAFLAIASISNISKNIGWLATSATRAQMHQTFALYDK